jgi:23S rRNA pseudouridine2605 synthase
LQRLQKVMAARGAGSRRACEELILAGRVQVDRQVVTELGFKVDPARQEIRVDGEVLRAPALVYYAVHKPRGIVSTHDDPSGRPRVVDLVPERQRVFTVGRLDLHSEGLILLTNDGELANHLAHPRYGVEKAYEVVVAGDISREALEALKRGVYLAEGFAKVEEIHVRERHRTYTLLEMTLREGRNRELRRLLARVGHKVQRLIRVAIDGVRLGELKPGDWRILTVEEIESLRRASARVVARGKEKAGAKGQAAEPAKKKSWFEGKKFKPTIIK